MNNSISQQNYSFSHNRILSSHWQVKIFFPGSQSFIILDFRKYLGPGAHVFSKRYYVTFRASGTQRIIWKMDHQGLTELQGELYSVKGWSSVSLTLAQLRKLSLKGLYNKREEVERYLCPP